MHPTLPSVHPVNDELAARAYADLFPAVYLLFHRRDGKRRALSGPSMAVLTHLALSGPITIGECTAHLRRAQSVVSEMVDQLERHGLVARVRDPADRRRTDVWLTDAGRTRLVEEQQVLSATALARALRRMPAPARRALIDSTSALVAAAAPTTKPRRNP
jgi:DNA-binding MarR family transcriptional regulator